MERRPSPWTSPSWKHPCCSSRHSLAGRRATLFTGANPSRLRGAAMKRIADPNELGPAKQTHVVVTGRSLWVPLAVGLVAGLLANFSGLPRWPTFVALLVAMFLTTYVVAS